VNFFVSEYSSVKVIGWMEGLYLWVLECPFVEPNASVIENSFFVKLSWSDRAIFAVKRIAVVGKNLPEVVNFKDSSKNFVDDNLPVGFTCSVDKNSSDDKHFLD
jgi:hypothetical protein